MFDFLQYVVGEKQCYFNVLLDPDQLDDRTILVKTEAKPNFDHNHKQVFP